MSGAGKTTVLDQLRRRGRLTVDTDYGGWEQPAGVWDEARMAKLLAESRDVVVSGTVSNQGRFYDRFEHVVLLSAPVDVLLDRCRRRTNNPYGKSVVDQEEVRRHVHEVEPLLRRGATIELDGRRPVAWLADVIDGLVARSS